MPSKRLLWFVVSVLLVAGWCVVSPVLERLSEESSSVDSTLSVSPYGFKALYYLMDTVQDKPVALWQHSIMRLSPTEPKTVWFLEPGPGLFFDGAAYRNHLRRLVEGGYHLVFVLDGEALTRQAPEHPPAGTATEKAPPNPLDFLNAWFDLSLLAHPGESLPRPAAEMAVTSRLDSRNLRQLRYQEPKLNRKAMRRFLGKFAKKRQRFVAPPPPKVTFLLDIAQGASPEGVLLTDTAGRPLLRHYRRGRGGITVFPNSFLLKNAQLTQGDNAPLALALQELSPHSREILFETYSDGFRDNRDFLTYLATGRGLALFLSATTLLLALCLWMMGQPVRRRETDKASDERHFTQETFIAALSRHYLSTGQWRALYQRLLRGFEHDLQRRYPHLPTEERLKVLAQNPLLGISLEDLQALFRLQSISTEAAFVRHSQQLLNIHREVFRHEQSRFPVGSRRS